jgi:hypothetical protein
LDIGIYLEFGAWDLVLSAFESHDISDIVLVVDQPQR